MSFDQFFAQQRHAECLQKQRDNYTARVRAIALATDDDNAVVKDYRVSQNSQYFNRGDHGHTSANFIGVTKYQGHQERPNLFDFLSPTPLSVLFEGGGSSWEASLDAKNIYEPGESQEYVMPTVVVRMPALDDALWPRTLIVDLVQSFRLYTSPVPSERHFFGASGWGNMHLLQMHSVFPPILPALQWADRVYAILKLGLSVAQQVAQKIVAMCIVQTDPWAAAFAKSVNARSAVASCNNWYLPIPVACMSTLDPTDRKWCHVGGTLRCKVEMACYDAYAHLCWQDRLQLRACALWQTGTQCELFYNKYLIDKVRWDYRYDVVRASIKQRCDTPQEYLQVCMKSGYQEALLGSRIKFISNLDRLTDGRANTALIVVVQRTGQIGVQHDWPLISEIAVTFLSQATQKRKRLYEISGSDAQKEADRANLKLFDFADASRTYVLPLFVSTDASIKWTDLHLCNKGLCVETRRQFLFTEAFDQLGVEFLFDSNQNLQNVMDFTVQVHFAGLRVVSEQNGTRFVY